MKYCCLKCEAETERPVLVCPNCAVGQDAWRLWFEANDFRFAATRNEAITPIFDHTGRISGENWHVVHSIIDAEFDSVVNVKNIDQAVKLHLQRQADLVRQEQERQAEIVRQERAAAENLARQQQADQRALREFLDFKAGSNLVARLQAGQKQTIIQRLVAKLRKMISSPLPS